MNIVLLGGYSQRNQPWIYEVQQALAPLFAKSVVHEYRHWQDEAIAFDFETELQAIEKEIAELEPYCIFAKSVGTVVALQGMISGVLRPQRCIFAGLPIQSALDLDVSLPELLRVNTTPALCIQNEQDTVGPYEMVKQLVQGLHQYQAVCLPGDNHEYKDFVALKTAIEAFVTEQQP